MAKTLFDVLTKIPEVDTSPHFSATVRRQQCKKVHNVGDVLLNYGFELRDHAQTECSHYRQLESGLVRPTPMIRRKLCSHAHFTPHGGRHSASTTALGDDDLEPSLSENPIVIIDTCASKRPKSQAQPALRIEQAIKTPDCG
jgi:hypothetical protein